MRLRMTEKGIVFILLISLLIGLMGCDIQGRFFKGKTDDFKQQDFRKGTSALEMKFVKDMPPNSIFVNDKFNIGLQLKNTGAFDIQNGVVKIVGYEKAAFNFQGDATEKSFSLVGKSAFISEGEQDIVTYLVESKCLPIFSTSGVGAQNETQSFKAIACFPYETVAEGELCIDPVQVRIEGQEAECKEKTLTFSGGQGGPVGVRSISTNRLFTGSDVEITVVVQLHKEDNKAEVYTSPGCTTGINQFTPQVLLSGQPLKCLPEDPKKRALTKKAGATLRCTTNIPLGSSAYLAPVQVKTNYFVKQSQIKKLKVQPLPGQSVKNCQESALESATAGSAGGSVSSCDQVAGFSCQDKSSNCPSGDRSCLEALGCRIGLCPGGKTNVCCP